MSGPIEKAPPLHVRVHAACLRGDEKEATRLVDAALKSAYRAGYRQGEIADD